MNTYTYIYANIIQKIYGCISNQHPFCSDYLIYIFVLLRLARAKICKYVLSSCNVILISDIFWKTKNSTREKTFI